MEFEEIVAIIRENAKKDVGNVEQFIKDNFNVDIEFAAQDYVVNEKYFDIGKYKFFVKLVSTDVDVRKKNMYEGIYFSPTVEQLKFIGKYKDVLMLEDVSKSVKYHHSIDGKFYEIDCADGAICLLTEEHDTLLHCTIETISHVVIQ